ncbi:MAG: glycosyltransferase [Agriterribacter sp.]
MKSNKQNKKILIFADWYEPGYKAGGPIRSCVNFAYYMQDEFDIYVYTRDRDLGDLHNYINIETNKWLLINNKHIFYASPEYLNWKQILSIIKDVEPDYLYLNNMFSRYFTIYPLMMKRRRLINSKLILAPRGMLKKSALQFKSSKKNIYLRLFKAFHLNKLIRFHATDNKEQDDIIHIFGKETDCIKLQNFPTPQDEFYSIDKQPGSIRIIFIGRIHPIKNLHFLLECLYNKRAKILLTVVGSIEDKLYWQRCESLITSISENVKVDFKKDIQHSQIGSLIQSHHLFVLPTEGENFGHAIFESFSYGRPVLISDQTPWKNLSKYKAGWDLPLRGKLPFESVLEKVIEMDNDEYQLWSKGAWNYSKNYQDTSLLKSKYIDLFS